MVKQCTATVPAEPVGKVQDRKSNDRPMSEINPDMARMAAAKDFMERSGTLAISSKIQIVHTSVLMSLCKYLKVNSTLNVYQSFQKLSPNLDGIGRTQTLQILTTPNVLIPGVGRMDALSQDKPGVIKRIVDWVTGSKQTQGQQQVQQ